MASVQRYAGLRQRSRKVCVLQSKKQRVKRWLHLGSVLDARQRFKSLLGDGYGPKSDLFAFACPFHRNGYRFVPLSRLVLALPFTNTSLIHFLVVLYQQTISWKRRSRYVTYRLRPWRGHVVVVPADDTRGWHCSENAVDLRMSLWLAWQLDAARRSAAAKPPIAWVWVAVCCERITHEQLQFKSTHG